ncbi:MAG: polyphenol oxidase family protein [Demequina sp.]
MIDAGLPIHAFFTTREGGVSVPPYESLNVAFHVGDEPRAVATNRARAGDLAGAPVSFLDAAHGIKVARVASPGEAPPTADALVATVPGVAVATIAADCVPILLHDSATGAVAAVHAGREGVFSGVIDATVAQLLDLRGGRGVRGRMRASIGPAICGRCYEVPPDMRERVAARHPSAFATTRAGTAALDLPRAIEARLGQLGFHAIVRVHECTAESPRLFSHRRDGVTGRFAGVAVCE